MMTYLEDKNFLQQICKKMNSSKSVRIISYTKNDEPIEAIEGKATSGSINIDGNSSTRRSCSLTLLTDNLNIHDFYWSLTTRFSVEIGLENTTDQYTNEKIIWFPMGYYIISSFSIFLSTTGAQVSIQGKDKMSMLNGDLGGKLTAETDFGVEDIINSDGELTHYNIPIKQIIKEMVHVYGQEPYGNIILNDIDDYGLNLETYYGEDPIYILIPVEENDKLSKIQIITNPETKIFSENGIQQALKDILEENLYKLIGSNDNTPKYKISKNSNDLYYIRKLSYGETFGYILTDLVYAGELIGKAGETITNILDKIKTMLGDYEYFYSIDGKFIFQKQKAYKSNGEQSLTQDQDGIITDYNYSDIDLTFTDLSLLTSLSNNVQINNLKNDFTVWGQKKGIDGSSIPIHMRYAIDKKPKQYVSIGLDQKRVDLITQKYPKQSQGLETKSSITYTTDDYDWRELIYQMALDYQKLHFTDEYANWLKEANNDLVEDSLLSLNNGLNLSSGKTGYEQYYTDLLGFWRQLYDPLTHWHKNVTEAPEKLLFWFDFLDTPSDSLQKYSIQNIGLRSMVKNDNTIKVIKYLPENKIVIINDDTEQYSEEEKNKIQTYQEFHDGYQYLWQSKLEDAEFINNLNLSANGKSAFVAIENLLYNYGYAQEGISLNCIPQYFLQPNTKIAIYADAANINGIYIISKITIPLTYNGQMSISATRAINKFERSEITNDK